MWGGGRPTWLRFLLRCDLGGLGGGDDLVERAVEFRDGAGDALIGSGLRLVGRVELLLRGIDGLLRIALLALRVGQDGVMFAVVGVVLTWERSLKMVCEERGLRSYFTWPTPRGLLRPG
jgi:hypothetical protein